MMRSLRLDIAIGLPEILAEEPGKKDRLTTQIDSHYRSLFVPL